MSSITCPKCGANNQSTARFCLTCGTPLAAPAALSQQLYSTPLQSQPSQPYYSYNPNYWDSQAAGRINNTKTGLLLLMIGSLLSWIPFVGVVGGLLVLIGAIFIIIGREGFGHEHARNVIAAIIIFVVGLGIFVIGFVATLFATISNAIMNPGAALTQPDWYTVLLLTAGAIVGIAEVVLTYALQNDTGRALLWTALILAIVTGIVNSYLVLPNVASTPRFIFNPATYLLTAVLAAPSAFLYGIAFYMARERIEHREIPSPTPSQAGPNPTSPIT